MRKVLVIGLILLALSGISTVGIAAAQDATTLEMGKWVEGTISNDKLEVKYSVAGKQGQVALFEMIPKPGSDSSLDGEMTLAFPNGTVIGQNDDFSYPLSLIVVEFPADSNYVLTATRSGGKDGSSEGDYWIRLTTPELLKPGTKMDMTIKSYSSDETPANVYVIRPASDGAVKIGFSQQISDLFASLELDQWTNDSYPDSVLSLSNTARVSAATFSVDLEAGQFYVLIVDRSFGSYGSTDEATVTVTIS